MTRLNLQFEKLTHKAQFSPHESLREDDHSRNSCLKISGHMGMTQISFDPISYLWITYSPIIYKKKIYAKKRGRRPAFPVPIDPLLNIN